MMKMVRGERMREKKGKVEFCYFIKGTLLHQLCRYIICHVRYIYIQTFTKTSRSNIQCNAILTTIIPKLTNKLYLIPTPPSNWNGNDHSSLDQTK